MYPSRDFVLVRGASDDLAQRLHLVALLVNEQLGVTDDVDEQNMPDLEFQLRIR